MEKKQLKFKIYQHECVDCGWKIWRDYPVENPKCSQCESTNPPKVTEDELIREMVTHDTYTPEDYERAKRIAQEIVDGKPLEEIEGLDVSTDLLSAAEEGDVWVTAAFPSGGGYSEIERVYFKYCCIVGGMTASFGPLAEPSTHSYY